MPYPASPKAATGRLPQRLDRPPQNGDINDQHSADNPKIAPAIQSGRPISRVRGGNTAAISIVLPAPIAINEKNNRKKALRRSGLDTSGGIVCPSLILMSSAGLPEMSSNKQMVP